MNEVYIHPSNAIGIVAWDDDYPRQQDMLSDDDFRIHWCGDCGNEIEERDGDYRCPVCEGPWEEDGDAV